MGVLKTFSIKRIEIIGHCTKHAYSANVGRGGDVPLYALWKKCCDFDASLHCFGLLFDLLLTRSKPFTASITHCIPPS
jgi:hypothetical protein